MTKRAFSLLFTLLVFFYCTTTASAQQYVNDVVVAGTDFLSKTGNYPCSFSDLIFYGEENMSSSWTKKSGTTPGKGNYAITNGSLYGGEKNSNDTFFSHMIDGLLTTSGHNNYTIKIYFKAVGRVEVQALWKKPGTNNQQNKQLQTDGTNSEISLEFSITATSSSFSYQFQRQGGSGTIQVTKVEVIGDTEAKITSSLGFDVCAGNTTTLQVLGHTGSYQWQRSENATGPWTNIQGATSSRLDVEVNKAYYYKVGNIVSEELTPTMCCAYESNPNYIKEVRFTMTGTQPENLPAGATIDQTPGSGYKFYTAGAHRNKIEDGEYAVVHKATDGGYWGDTPFVSKIVGKDYTGPSSNDGFLLVNCNPSNSGKPMYEQIVTGLCPGAMHNFSISVVSVDINPAEEGIAVKMQVYAMNGNTVGEALLRNPITIRKSCGEGWGDPYSASITTPVGCTSVKISVINANTSGRNEGNDVGIDDILFSRCNPEIALYSDAAFTMTDQTVCPSTTTATALYVSEPANLNAIFPTSKYYYYEFKNATGNWEAITGAPNPTTAANFPVTLTATTTYRVWVAADASTVVKAAKGQIPNTDCTSYAVSNAVTLTHDCLCEASTAPTVKPYTECASTTKLDLHKQITSTTTGGTIRWYSSETATTPMTDAEATAVDVSTAGTYHYYVTYQKDKDITTGDEYCESEKTELTVTVKDKITLTIDKSSISGCWANFESDASRTFTVTVPNGATIKWYSVDASGTETDLNNDNSKTYTIAKQTAAVSGKIRVKASSTSACENSVDATYALSENTQFTLSAPAMVCTTAPQADIKATITSGSGNYKWEKDGTEVKTGTLTAGTTELIYKDSSVGTTEGTVTYKLTIGDVTACGSSQTIEVAVGDKIKFDMSCQQGTTVCEGTNVTIKAERELLTGESFEWYKNDVLVSGVSGNTLNDTDALTANTTYKAVLKNGPCDGENTITINVDKKPQPVLSVTKSDICLGDTLSVINSDATVLGSNPTYKWLEDGVAITGESSKNLKQYKPQEQGTKTYTLEVTNGTCNNSATATANVHAAIEFTATADPAKICAGNPTTLTTNALQKYPSASFSWWLGTDSLSADTSYEVQPVQTGKVIYTAKVVDICQATKEVEVEVEPGIVAQLADSTTICDGDEATLEVHTSGNYNYKWAPAKDLATPEKQQTKASPNVDTWYYVAIFSDVCSTSDSIYVKVNPRPEITQLEETDKRQVTVDATGGTPDYTFYIDTKEVPYTYRVIGDVPIGYHRMYVVDAVGCEVDSLFEIAPIPITPQKFFTPNGIGDEKTNLWTVEDLDENYTSYIVEIYDRYGRKLYEYRTGSFNINSTNSSEELGWDGNYNGHQMPSDDYWYLITVEEIRKQYTGHFILKR